MMFRPQGQGKVPGLDAGAVRRVFARRAGTLTVEVTKTRGIALCERASREECRDRDLRQVCHVLLDS